MPASEATSIIGGVPTVDRQYEYVGAMIARGSVICSGTLIAPTVVLSAGHCVNDVFTGGTTPGFTFALDGDAASAEEITPGSTMHPHESFDLFTDPPKEGVSLWYDVSILKLAEPVTDRAFARLPTAAMATAALIPGNQVDMVGYGFADVERTMYGLQTRATATIIDVNETEIQVTDLKIGESQACNGDSGGPALMMLAGAEHEVGIVSRSAKDAPGCVDGAVYTRTDAYLPWILSVAPEVCAVNPVEGCDAVPDAAPPPPDARWPDAAIPDAAGDAAIPDAGPDAAVVDAALPDAGDPDAGEPDARRPDAAPSEALIRGEDDGLGCAVGGAPDGDGDRDGDGSSPLVVVWAGVALVAITRRRTRSR